MAVPGAITYWDVPLGGVVWNKGIRSPFENDATELSTRGSSRSSESDSSQLLPLQKIATEQMARRRELRAHEVYSFDHVALKEAKVWDRGRDGDFRQGTNRLILDVDILESEWPALKCLCVGREKHRSGEGTEGKKVKHYVLAVRPREDLTESGIYERVGVGMLESSFISWDDKEEHIKIV